MEKTARAELIAALVTDKHSGFVDGDESMLETCSDERLDKFRAAADASRSASNSRSTVDTELRNVAARLKVAEERIKAGEQPMSKEEFLAKAPDEFKATLAAAAAVEDAERAALVSVLKDCGAHTEDELKQMSIPDLQKLARYARVKAPDFSGRGIPAQRNAQDRESYAPPDPYAEGIKALRARDSKAVN